MNNIIQELEKMKNQLETYYNYVELAPSDLSYLNLLRYGFLDLIGRINEVLEEIKTNEIH